ncbi:MAG: hypothetical protein ACQEP1_06575 [Nanobdellota archaeon]
MAKKKRVKSHVLEKVIGVLMVLFGVAALYVFANAKFGNSSIGYESVAIIEILLIVVLAILSQTLVLIKIYDQHQ